MHKSDLALDLIEAARLRPLAFVASAFVAGALALLLIAPALALGFALLGAFLGLAVAAALALTAIRFAAAVRA